MTYCSKCGFGHWVRECPTCGYIEGCEKLKENEMDFIITVWKDGTWKLWSTTDAHYACNDKNPDWLVNIPINENGDLLQIIRDFISCWNEDEVYPDSKSSGVLERAKKVI